MTPAEYARKVGVSTPLVQRWIAQERIRFKVRRHGSRKFYEVPDQPRPEKKTRGQG